MNPEEIQQSDYDNLSPEDKEEVTATLQELKDEGQEIDIKLDEKVEPESNEDPDPKPEEVEQKEKEPEKVEKKDPEDPEKKPDEEKEPDPNAKKEDEADNRDVKFMPAWKHKVAEKNWEKRETELKTEIEKLSKNPPEPEKKPVENDTKTSEAIGKLADEYGVDEGLVKGLYDLMPKAKGEMPEGLAEKLGQLDSVVAEKQEAADEATHTTEFTSKIAPLVKTEYGDVSAEGLKEISDRLYELAHTDAYNKIPLNEIYAARAEFRGKINTPKPSAEDTGGGGKTPQGNVIDFEKVTEADISKMDDATLDKLEQYHLDKEGVK